MAKGQSSASSATRKKHARKSGKDTPAPELLPREKKPKGKDKGKNKEPKKKVYIAPAKPAPVQQDPLDTLGLAHQLPPELLVVLRKFSKKDAVTKTKALEELQAGWIDKAKKEEEGSYTSEILVLMLPVWLHYIPALFTHPSRRIRLLTAGLHSSLLRISHLRDQIFFFIRDVASEDQAESILGSWCMASRDVDRQVSIYARRSWEEATSLSVSADKLHIAGTLLHSLISFVQRAILNPTELYLYLNPVQVAVDLTPPKKIHGRIVLSPPIKKEEEDGGSRTRGDGDEENDSDRRARLRVGGLGVVQWLLDARAKNAGSESLQDLMDMLSNPALWSSLHYADACPFVDTESFGFAQPVVRTSAWSLLQALLQHWKDRMDPLVQLLSVAVLRSAFVEPDTQVRSAMWRPLLTFLKEFPRAWEWEASFDLDQQDEGEDDSEVEDADESTKPLAQGTEAAALVASRSHSKAYHEFFQFLELGCSGSPLQGYPTVLIILSTIPSSILLASSSLPAYPAADFFTSFWAAIDGRALSALERASTSKEFLSALLECMTFIIRRVRNGSPPAGEVQQTQVNGIDEAVKKLVADQYARVWQELTATKLKLDATVAGVLMAKNLQILEQVDTSLFDAAWNAFSPSMKTQAMIAGPHNSHLVSTVLKTFCATFEHGSRVHTIGNAFIHTIAGSISTRCQSILASPEAETEASVAREAVATLADVIEAFGDALFHETEFALLIDQTIRTYAYTLLTLSPHLLVVYLSHRQDQVGTLHLWLTLLSSISTHSDAIYTTLPPLVDAAQAGVLPEHLTAAEGEFDQSVNKLFTDAVGGHNTSSLPLLLRLVRNAKPFVTDDSFEALLEYAISDFGENFESVFSRNEVDLPRLDVLLDVLSTSFEVRPELSSDESVCSSLLPGLFLFAYLLPKSCELDGARSVVLAKALWTSWLGRATDGLKNVILEMIMLQLHDAVWDVSTRASPRDIIKVLTEDNPGITSVTLEDILPSQARLDDELKALRSDPAHPSLAINHPLVPPASTFDPAKGSGWSTDIFGLTSYARAVSALLSVFIEDRHAAKTSIWALRHLLVLSFYADEVMQMSLSPSPVFSDKISKNVLADLITQVRQLTAYMLVVPSEVGWHANVISGVSNDRSKVEGELAKFVVELVSAAMRTDSYRDSAVLLAALQHIVGDADKGEADLWMGLGRKIEKSAPQTALAIVTAVVQSGSEPPRMERYRNELAAGILGIPSTKANTDGILLLRRLAATAPDFDSEVVFLPQPRAVNFMKQCQQWIASDEEIDEDVESEMTAVFYHLVPILQNVSGGHWDFIFDVIENNLENSSFDDDMTLTILWRTIRLIQVIEDQVTYNKALRADWQRRQMAILSLLRDLVASEPKSPSLSTPRSTCREAALSIIQNLPHSLINHEMLSTMSHLLSDPSVDVQKMAYDLLREAAKKRTEYLVIESGVNTEDVKIDLPVELVNLLQSTLDEEQGSPFACMLGWMVAFDLFQNASMKVRSGYTDHLRSLDLIAKHFIPLVLDALGLYGRAGQSFKLGIWAVDEFYLESFDPDNTLSLPLFAAHIYYRGLVTAPSLFRTWLLDCKDYTLSTSVANYTSQHFSPVIIGHELGHVKSPDVTAELNSDNFVVKVASNTNEVTGVFTVDEQQLEIILKIPTDWPLHGIEVKESKRVGVTENRWRGWLLGTQQIVMYQNGHIADALSLFKKNVSLHFEGLIECAICYSIISAIDGDRPRKPCKTCKNLFHSSCLFKWFHSSHSSSCPLCRSDIF